MRSDTNSTCDQDSWESIGPLSGGALRHRYQTVGYYVSLLAEARGHRPVPDVATPQDFRSAVLKRPSPRRASRTSTAPLSCRRRANGSPAAPPSRPTAKTTRYDFALIERKE
ncbi:MAG: RimK-like ATPgrasp N-terminal domain-containing protein [Opitutales bacterium]